MKSYLKTTLPALTGVEQQRSLQQILDTKPKNSSIRVFGYGSLLWKPIISFRKYQKAILKGWSRQVCNWTIHARGTSSNPGLVFGLNKDTNGSCEGLVFEFYEKSLLPDLKNLWAQEMHSNLYHPRWLPIFTQKEQYSVIAFVVNQNHPLYVSNIPDDEAADIICAASGIFGPCADYFTDTTTALKKMGLKDKNIENLTKLIKARKSR